MPSLKKKLIVEQFQGNYFNVFLVYWLLGKLLSLVQIAWSEYGYFQSSDGMLATIIMVTLLYLHDSTLPDWYSFRQLSGERYWQRSLESSPRLQWTQNATDIVFLPWNYVLKYIMTVWTSFSIPQACLQFLLKSEHQCCHQYMLC